MSHTQISRDTRIETAVHELLDSRAASRIYVYLLRHQGARSNAIIRGTKLHPSTVRELLSDLYTQKIITRKKIRTDRIGKNPYQYYAVSPLLLVQRRVKIIESRLNNILRLSDTTQNTPKVVQITINHPEGAV